MSAIKRWPKLEGLRTFLTMPPGLNLSSLVRLPTRLRSRCLSIPSRDVSARGLLSECASPPLLLDFVLSAAAAAADDEADPRDFIAKMKESVSINLCRASDP